MTMKTTRQFALSGALIVLVGLTTGGCKLECQSDAGNEVEDVIDEVGDEVEDVVEETKKD